MGGSLEGTLLEATREPACHKEKLTATRGKALNRDLVLEAIPGVRTLPCRMEGRPRRELLAQRPSSGACDENPGGIRQNERVKPRIQACMGELQVEGNHHIVTSSASALFLGGE